MFNLEPRSKCLFGVSGNSGDSLGVTTHKAGSNSGAADGRFGRKRDSERNIQHSLTDFCPCGIFSTATRRVDLLHFPGAEFTENSVAMGFDACDSFQNALQKLSVVVRAWRQTRRAGLDLTSGTVRLAWIAGSNPDPLADQGE